MIVPINLEMIMIQKYKRMSERLEHVIQTMENFVNNMSNFPDE